MDKYSLFSINGDNLKNKELVLNSFKKFFGVNSSRIINILGLVGMNKNLKLSNINKYYFDLIKTLIFNLYVIEDKLKFIRYTQKMHYVHVRNYRAIRYVLGLPVRGQRTSTNAKTSRKFSIRKIY